MKELDKAFDEHIEVMDNASTQKNDVQAATKIMGTVKLTEDSIIYIPTPTADPQGTQHKVASSCVPKIIYSCQLITQIP